MRFCPHFCPESIINPIFLLWKTYRKNMTSAIFNSVYPRQILYMKICLENLIFGLSSFKIICHTTIAICKWLLLSKNFNWQKRKILLFFIFITTCLLVCVVNDNIQSNKHKWLIDWCKYHPFTYRIYCVYTCFPGEYIWIMIMSLK